jgi:hypothetical protein
MDLPIARAVVAAVQSTSREPVVRMPTLGGSLPLVIFRDVLGATTITGPAGEPRQQPARREREPAHRQPVGRHRDDGGDHYDAVRGGKGEAGSARGGTGGWGARLPTPPPSTSRAIRAASARLDERRSGLRDRVTLMRRAVVAVRPGRRSRRAPPDAARIQLPEPERDGRPPAPDQAAKPFRSPEAEVFLNLLRTSTLLVGALSDLLREHD